MEVYWATRGTAPLVLIFGIRWMWVVSFTADCFSPGRWALLPKLTMGRTASFYVLEKSLAHAGNRAILPRSWKPFPGHYIDRVISVGFSKIISPCVLPCSIALLQPHIFRSAPLFERGKPLHTSRRQISIAAEQLAERSAAQRLCFADCRNWI